MNQLLAYSIPVSISLSVLYLIYKLVMSGEKEFTLNRYILLGIYAAAFITPIIFQKLQSLNFSSTVISPNMIEMPELTNTDLPVPDTAVTPIWPIILITIYVAGVVAMTLLTVFTWIKLIRIVAKGEKHPFGRYTITVTDNQRMAPFSWCGYIIMNRNDYSADHALILTHELSHLRHRHWTDLLIAQLVIVFNWFNPAAWLMREELKTIHEYQADMSVIGSGADIKDYQLLLIKKAVGSRFPSLTNSLNHSKLKKRITMMMKNRPNRWRRTRALALVPAIAAALVVINIPAVARTVSAIRSTPTDRLYDTGDKITNLSVDNEELLISSVEKNDISSSVKVSADTTVDRKTRVHTDNTDSEKKTYYATVTLHDGKKKTYYGRVTFSDGEPAVGAIIKPDDGSEGVCTDKNGQFAITIPEGTETKLSILYPDRSVVSTSEITLNGKVLNYVLEGKSKKSSQPVSVITGNVTLTHISDGYEWYIDGKHATVSDIQALKTGEIKELRIYEDGNKKTGYITLHDQP